MNRHFAALVAVIVYGCLVSGTVWTQFSTVTFQITELLQCEDIGTGEIDGTFRLQRINRTLLVLEGNATFKVPVDNELESTAVLYIWGNGGYRQIYVFKEMNVCTGLATFLGGAWHSIWTHAGLTAPVKCPIPKGTYELKGFDVQNFLKVNVPAFAPGKFRTVQSFSRTKDKRLLGCIHYVIDIQPKSFNS